MPNYELDRCEGPDGEVIPWTTVDQSLWPRNDMADSGMDGGMDMDSDARIDQGPELRADAGNDANTLDARMEAGPDAQTDAGSDAGMAPPNVSARFPWNGFYTGSVHVADDAPVVDHPLRPKFMWETVSGADEYQLQLTRECSIEGFRDCAFEDTELDEITAETLLRPATSLPVERAAPVGSRYFWRVRACATALDVAACSEWTEVRYLNVGRQENDYNGDGYADLVVGAPGQNTTGDRSGAAYVYFGRSTGTGTNPNVWINNPLAQAGGWFGGAVAPAGDVNGDGFGDIVISAPNQDSPIENEGVTYLFFGGRRGPGTTPSVTLDSPANQAEGRFGHAVSSAGDINADGYADIVVGSPVQDAPAEDEGSAYLYFGGPAGPTSLPNVTFDNPDNQANGQFGYSVANGQDLNGDGNVDLLIGAVNQSSAEVSGGHMFVYQGGIDVIASPTSRIGNPRGYEGERFGHSIAGIGDTNGDGFGDVLVGAPSGAPPGPVSVGQGVSYLFLGRDGDLATYDLVIEGPFVTGASSGGHVAGAGDLNGDGFMDFAVGATGVGAGGPRSNIGEASVYLGAAPPAAFAAARLRNPEQVGWAFFGGVAGLRDMNGDGLSDLAVAASLQDAPAEDEGNVFLYLGATELATTPSRTLDNPANQVRGYFGSAL